MLRPEAETLDAEIEVGEAAAADLGRCVLCCEALGVVPMEGLPTSADVVMLGLVAIPLAIAMLIRCVGAIRSRVRHHHEPVPRRRL